MAPRASVSFTCTFCYQTSEDPHVVGHEARLACSACHAALIDLAICWVCGEIVYRGDDKLVHRGVPLLELFDEGHCADEEGSSSTMRRVAGTSGKGRMREVEVPPLCAACYLSTEGEDVVQQGLARVERADGGLSRARWDAGEGRAGRLRRAPASIRTLSRDSSSLRRAGDGSHDQAREYPATPPVESTIYVSINDPIGQPTFRPSPTKPIPIWMQPFPRTAQLEEKWQRANIPRRHLAELAQTLATSTSETSKLESAASPGLTKRPGTVVSPASPLRTPPGSSSVWTPHEIRRAPPLSWVSNEPLKRPSSRIASRLERLEKSGTTTSSGYVTPPETPSEQIRRYKTPPPQLRRITRRSVVRRTPPPQSSEYLELYNPIRSPSPRLRTTQPAVVAPRRASREAGLELSREMASMMSESISNHGQNHGTDRILFNGADSPQELGKKKNMQALRKLFGGK
ncbi:hypothetical protein CGRA01v4_07307 [Colletotrichum graminicola]|uniref:LIM zinc-binding domain-containing protein n=1 Tax=Colletotrichum graminicola (strain M1.001 / M2 / FGSC 10212) TaxID=645133 RepID=E3QCB7_COLGM|nr:uncharacterized protein GLRG_03649 [Colletotrichum graminicola M1.001]EFQ28505.1 hypothetical protein GLRG_03649 [Colletotrichum graminicola M1.001]WDK16025.1 hypothetical protein CGRA01v4_07307 [Colletotrichum graminicola]